MRHESKQNKYAYGCDEPRKGRSIMANVKTIIKKLINLGFSEDKLMMMTEKEIREAYKVAKEEFTMKNNANTTATNNNATTIKEESTMETLATRTLNMNKTERLVYVLDIALHVTKTSDELYVKKDELAKFLFDNDIISRMPSKNELKRTKRQVFVDILDTAVQNLIKNKITPVNTAPVSDAKAKTIEVLKLIKDDAVANHNKGFGTTVSAYMLCAYILQAGYGIKKLKGHESEITDKQKDTVKKVRQWLIDKGYIKACVYKTNGKSVYTDDYDGNHADSMIHHSKSLGLTCVGVSSYKVTF